VSDRHSRVIAQRYFNAPHTLGTIPPPLFPSKHFPPSSAPYGEQPEYVRASRSRRREAPCCIGGGDRLGLTGSSGRLDGDTPGGGLIPGLDPGLLTGERLGLIPRGGGDAPRVGDPRGGGDAPLMGDLSGPDPSGDGPRVGDPGTKRGHEIFTNVKEIIGASLQYPSVVWGTPCTLRRRRRN
jgi:hypothetical protein